jgi:hypothetical protein
MLHILSISTHTVCITVENWRRGWVWVLAPIPVLDSVRLHKKYLESLAYWLVPFVITLRSQCCFVCPNIISVPMQEVCLLPKLSATIDIGMNFDLTVSCTCIVMLICTTTKSSYRDFAPGYCVALNLDGAAIKHFTALT